MNDRKAALTCLTLSHIGIVAGFLLTWDDLPQRVASHFNAAGVPDGWTTRSNYLLGIGAVVFGGSAFILALFYCVRFFPPSMINLPHREHWLAAERRWTTMDTLLNAGIWFTCFQALFGFGLHWLIVEANRSPGARLGPGVWLLAGCFLGITGLWVFALIRRFTRDV